MPGMNFRDLWLSLPRAKREQLAHDAGTSYKYLQKLSGHFGVPSVQLIQRLKACYPRLTYEGFLPEADGRKRSAAKRPAAKRKRVAA